MAMDDIHAGDVVITVPWQACLSSEHLENNTAHPLSRIARDNRDKLSPVDMLAIYILYEYHNPQSALAPFLCACTLRPLPTTTHHPLNHPWQARCRAS